MSTNNESIICENNKGDDVNAIIAFGILIVLIILLFIFIFSTYESNPYDKDFQDVMSVGNTKQIIGNKSYEIVDVCGVKGGGFIQYYDCDIYYYPLK